MENPRVALFLFGAAVVLLVVVAGSIILILRMIPAYKSATAKGVAEKEHAEQVNANYLRAGFRVRKGFFVVESVTGVLAGVMFTQKAYSGSRNVFPSVEVSVPSALRGEFTITRGSTVEGKTGDAEFDGNFYLRGSPRDFVQTVFGNARNRDAVLVLFRKGFDRVTLAGGKVFAEKMHERHLIDLPVVTDAVARLAELCNTPRIAGAI